MDFEKIIEKLNRSFSEPLIESYKRRIIVWYDEEKEFIDKLDEITLKIARLLKLNGSNNFEIRTIKFYK